VADEELQEPTAEFILSDPTDDDPLSTDPDGEWNPSNNLNLTYNNLLKALGMVRRSVSDTASAREVVEFEIQQLEERVEDPEGSLGSVRAAIADLTTQLTLIGACFDNLLSISAQFQTDVERFRTERELLKASYAAVEALTVMGDTVSVTPSPGSSPRTA
jgi:phage shock protein A